MSGVVKAGSSLSGMDVSARPSIAARARRELAQPFPRRTINKVQACAVMGVSKRTMDHWIAKRTIDSIRVGRERRIYVDSLPYIGSPRKVVTINEARQIARVSRRTIYNWIGRGWLERVREPGHLPRIYLDSLRRISL